MKDLRALKDDEKLKPRTQTERPGPKINVPKYSMNHPHTGPMWDGGRLKDAFRVQQKGASELSRRGNPQPPEEAYD